MPVSSQTMTRGLRACPESRADPFELALAPHPIFPDLVPRSSNMLHRGGYRQRENEGRSNSQRAFEPHPASVEFDKPLADAQPQATAALVTPQSVRTLVEGLEESFGILRRDAWPRIGHADDDVLILAGDLHLDPASSQ